MHCWTGLRPYCRADVPLREHTWYRLGGPARWFLTPLDEDQLLEIPLLCRDAGLPWRVLGSGANVLVRDAGFDGAVISLRQGKFTSFDEHGGLIHAGGGSDLTKLVKFASDAGLGGLECLAGIPATVGGAVRMNAGGKYGSISQFIVDVTLMDESGAIESRLPHELGFAYRSSYLAGKIVIAATLRTEPDDPQRTRARFKSIWNEKHATQPPLSERTAGCIFKNPPGHSAGRLLDQAGLKGRRVGGAEISPRHANFIVAHREATAADILALIDLATERVWSQFGIRLETEVDVW